MKSPKLFSHLCLLAFVLGATVSVARADEPTPEAKAAMLQQAAEAAQIRKAAADKAVQDLQNMAQPFRDILAKAKPEQAKVQAAMQAAEKDLPVKQEAAKKAEAEKPAIDKAAQDTAAAAALAADDKASVAKLLAELSAAVKTAQESAAKAKANLDKAPNDPLLTAAKAAADKFAADSDVLTKAVAARMAESDKVAADMAAKAKVEADKAAAHAKLVADSATAAKAVADMIEAHKATLAKLATDIQQAETSLAGIQPEIDKALAQLAVVAAETVTALQSSQKALSDIGKFVVFSHQVAPIFAKRCLACHNARTAKGRYNMDSFAAIMKGGEQGDTVVPGDGELSNLSVVIANGSMPKDADPLTKEEIDIIKKWIQLGAVLDAGKDANAPLVNIMPKLPHPAAPPSYPAPLSVTALAFSPDGTQLASSGYHEVIQWNPADNQIIRRITNVAERTYDLQYSPDGKLLAVAAGTPGQMGEVKLFNPADGALIKDLVTVTDSMFAVAFSPNGQRLAAAGADRSIRVFDVNTGKQELLIEDHADWVMGIAWSPDGSKLASASRDKTSKVFNSVTGESVATFPGHGEPVFGVAWLPSGAEIATAGRDRQIRVWNATNAQQVRAIGGFGNEVFRIIITPEGRLFSCSADQTAREHKLDGNAVRTFSGHKDWVYGLAFNPATKKLATGSWEGEVRIWNAEDGAALQTFVAAPGLAPAAPPAAK